MYLYHNSQNYSITFRPLARADYPQLAAWIAQPHVARWWLDPTTIAEIAAEYDPSLEPGSTFRGFIVVAGDRPIGFIQYYLEDGETGIDYFIGDPAFIGRGYGSALIPQFVTQVVRPAFPQATSVIADPEVANLASIRVLEKAGFERAGVVPGEYGPGRPEQLMRLRL